jgi:aspartate/methionine/tyrosine aminotransferase
MSGLRVGVLSSGDPDVRAAAAHLAIVASPSSDTQAVLREMLADSTFLDTFERERVRRLADAYAATTKALDENGIGYVEAAAGLYVWIDLRAHLEYPTFESERRLWRRLFETGRVSISPGGLFHTPEPGWFRLCFASAADGVRTGIERIASALDGDQ